jgi:hypothetical protein
LDTGSNEIIGLRVVDVDSDGRLEYVFCTDYRLYVFEVLTGALEDSIVGFGGDDVAVGNVDDDADLEIVIADPSVGTVLNGVTRAVEWSYLGGFGSDLSVADLDGDGREEIVAAWRWDKIVIFDAELQSPRYELPTSHDIGALLLADADGDGQTEIVYGDGQWGRLWIHDGATGALEGSHGNPSHGVTEIAVADSDDDGELEILWGAGFSSSGPDYLYVVNAVDGSQEWVSQDVLGPFYAMDYGDVDNDGEPELLYGSESSDSGYGDGLFFVHDASTKALEYQSGEPTGLDWTGLYRIGHANIDDDPQHEICITTSITYSALVICYDGVTHAEQWRLQTSSGLSFRAMKIGDVDADGELEIVTSTQREHTGAEGTFLYVFDAATGQQEWRSVDLGPGWTGLFHLRLAQLDDDDALEMVVGQGQGALWAFDGASKVLQFITLDYDTGSLATVRHGGDRGDDPRLQRQHRGAARRRHRPGRGVRVRVRRRDGDAHLLGDGSVGASVAQRSALARRHRPVRQRDGRRHRRGPEPGDRRQPRLAGSGDLRGARLLHRQRYGAGLQRQRPARRVRHRLPAEHRLRPRRGSRRVPTRRRRRRDDRRLRQLRHAGQRGPGGRRRRRRGRRLRQLHLFSQPGSGGRGPGRRRRHLRRLPRHTRGHRDRPGRMPRP